MVRDNSLSSKVLDVFVYTVMIVTLVVTLYPVLHVIASSFSGRIANETGQVTIFPVDFTVEPYQMLWQAGTVPNAFVNSVQYTFVGVIINMLVTTTFAYALSRKHLPLRGFYTMVAIIPMYFSGGLVPTFMLVTNLGLTNTMWALVLPVAMSITNFIIMRTFFQNLPAELEESAKLDGANDFVIFTQIILPLSKAVLYTIGLFYTVTHWNSWFNAMIYLRDSNMFPLQLILRQIVILAEDIREAAISGDFTNVAFIGGVNVIGIRFATLCVAIVPMLLIYPFVQRHFIKGVMIGSLKG
ncbi:MAG: carbohydrate ABC transporter permease [Defluviitaleaceae bacterium]|nr:carbohydrate ABC transporter permease [Defluviitaleaceae bacterium]